MNKLIILVSTALKMCVCGWGGVMCGVFDIIGRNSSVTFVNTDIRISNDRSYITEKALEIQISNDYHTPRNLVLVKIILQIRPLTADTRLPSEWN